MSARAGEESRVEGIDAGADDYLVKPFSARELMARVQTHLELARVRHESGELLRKNEERLRAFVTATADVVYRMSPDWSEMYQLDGKDFIADTKDPSRSWMDKYIHPDDQQRVKSVIQEAIRNKKNFQLEHRVLRADGSFGWAFSRAVPLLDESGAIVEWFGAVSDIASHKKMEQELLEAQSELECRVQQRTKELERAQTDLRNLSGKLLQLQDNERRRISRELHDSAGQTLTVLGMNLGQLEQLASDGNPRFAERLREAQDLVQRITQEIRTTSYLLHPPLLDENGIAAALRWYIEGLMQRTSLKVNLKVSEDFGRLPQDIELAIFRIVQESLTNVLRHSRCDSADIRLTHKNGNVTVQIEDHGQGIPDQKLAAIQEGRSGVGLRGMRDRVRHFNGEMNLNSTKSGTTVPITLPTQSTAIPVAV